MATSGRNEAAVPTPARIDDGNSTSTALGPTAPGGTTFTGAWTSTEGVGVLSFFAFSDQPFTAARLEWSTDGSTVDTDLLATADYLPSEELTSGFYVYYPDPSTYLLKPYYRVVLENTGTDQTILSAYTWVFPTGSNPFSFLDTTATPSTLQKALLTKPVTPSLEIAYFSDAVDGALPSGPAVTIDAIENTEPNVLDTGWIDTSTFAGKNIVGVLADCPLSVYLMNATDDQGDNIFGNLAPTLLTNANFPAQLSALYSDRYYRMVVVNTSGTTCTAYRAFSNAAPESTDGVTTALDQPVFGFFPANVQRSVIMGRQPDGDYINVPATGLAHDVDGTAVETTTPLSASATYSSGWVDTDGWDEVELVVVADEVSATNGVQIEFTDEADDPSPATRVLRALTLDASDVAAGGITVRFAPRLDGFRVTYTNGGQPQGSFFLSCTLRADATALPRTEIDANVNDTSESITTKGVIAVKDTTTGDYTNVGGTEVDGKEGFNTYLLGGEVDIAALSSWTSRLVAVPTSALEVTGSSPLTNRRTITVKAAVDNNKEIHVGPTAAVSVANAAVRPGETLTLDLDDTASVWAVAQAGVQSMSVVEIA